MIDQPQYNSCSGNTTFQYQTQVVQNVVQNQPNPSCSTIVCCPFRELGCLYKGPVCKLVKHMTVCSKTHLSLIHCTLTQQYETISKLRNTFEDLKEKRRLANEKIEELKKETTNNELLITFLNNSNEEQCKQWETIHFFRSGIFKPSSLTELIESAQTNLSSFAFINEFLWTIEDYKQKLKEAQDGTCVAVWSDDFYYIKRLTGTGDNGPRLRAVVFPNGTGGEEGTHISVLVQLQPSNVDKYLQWPFNRKIVITLVNQDPCANLKGNITKVLVPDPCMEACQQPNLKSENPCFGFPDFVSHKCLAVKGLDYNDSLLLRFTICPSDNDE